MTVESGGGLVERISCVKFWLMQQVVALTVVASLLLAVEANTHRLVAIEFRTTKDILEFLILLVLVN